MPLHVVKAVVCRVPAHMLLTTAIAPEVRLLLTRRQTSRPDVRGPTVHSSSNTLEPRSNLRREQPLLMHQHRQQLPHPQGPVCRLSSDAPASPCRQLCAIIKALPHLGDKRAYQHLKLLHILCRIDLHDLRMQSHGMRVS